MFLCDDFNLLIEVARSALFLKNITYPPVPTENTSPNILRAKWRRPDVAEEMHEVSVSFLGPWKFLPDIPVLLWHMFHGREPQVEAIQRWCHGSFVTLLEHRVGPPKVAAECTPHYDHEEDQWLMELQTDCRMRQDEPSEDKITITFKTPCSKRLEEKLADDFKQFLDKTVFMFYDITFEFTYWGTPYSRSGIDLPVPWSTSRKLKKFLRHRLGQASSLGSAWVCQDEDQTSDIVDVTCVSYGLDGESDCLPVWVLGPSGIPVPGFSITLFTQLVAEAAMLPPSPAPYVPLAGLPAPDLCLELPPQHELSKRRHAVVLVMMLPIEHRRFSKHDILVTKFDAFASLFWEPIVETLREVLQHPSLILEESSDFKTCQGMAAALSSIIRLSLNRNFREECFKLLEVNNSIDGQDAMEQYLQDYLLEMHTRPKILRNQLYHPPRATHLPPKDSDYTEEEWAEILKARKTSEDSQQQPGSQPSAINPDEASSSHNAPPEAKRQRLDSELNESFEATLATALEAADSDSLLDVSFESQLISTLDTVTPLNQPFLADDAPPLEADEAPNEQLHSGNLAFQAATDPDFWEE